MESSDHQYYKLLKKELISVMQLSHTGISDRIDDWKGKDIIAFQEDLRKKVNAYFSEKWFYNIHISGLMHSDSSLLYQGRKQVDIVATFTRKQFGEDNIISIWQLFLGEIHDHDEAI